MAGKKAKPTNHPRVKPGPERELDRVRHLLALDAATLMRRIEKRQEEMVDAFAKTRARAALLEPLRSWFPAAGFRELLLLSTSEQRTVSRFYESVDDLRWYFQYTEDMPGTLKGVFEAHRRELSETYARLRGALAVDVVLEPEDAADVIAQAVKEAEGRKKRA